MKYQGKSIVIALLSLAVISTSGAFSLAQISGAEQSTDDAFLKGHVEATLRDAEGNIIEYRQGDNHIVGLGLDLLVTELSNPSITGAITETSNGELSHMALGTGGETAPADDDTGLQTAITGCEDTISASSAGADTSGSNATIDIVFTATFSSADDANCETTSIDEVIITSGSGGDIFARNNFTLLEIATDESLQINWTFTFTDS